MNVLVSIIIFLFSLYVLAKDDFVLLRKNVSLTTIFDTSFFVGLSGLFFSRLFYALSHLSSAYLNPLVFFIIPYFPGLSGAGLLLGACLALYVIIMRKKLPLGKIFDIFAVSFLSAGGTFFLINALQFLLKKDFLQVGISAVASFFLFSVFLFIQKVVVKLSWKDGSIAFLSITCTTVLLVCLDFIAVRFRSLPVELPFLIALFFLIFISFLVRFFKSAGEKT